MNFIHPFSLLFFQLQFCDKCNIIAIFHFQIHVTEREINHMIISRVDNHFKVSLSVEFLDNNLQKEKKNTFQVTNPLLQQLQLFNKISKFSRCRQPIKRRTKFINFVTFRARFDQMIRNHVKYRSPISRSLESAVWPEGGMCATNFPTVAQRPEYPEIEARPRVALFLFFSPGSLSSPPARYYKDGGNWLKFKVIHFGRKVPSSSLMIAIISRIKAAETSNGKRDWDREWRKAGQAFDTSYLPRSLHSASWRSTRFWI